MVKLQAEMNGKPPPQEAEVLSVEAYIKRWLSTAANTVSPASLRSYRLAASLYIIPTVGHITLNSLERFHIEEMKANLSSCCTPASVRFALKTFSTALNAAVDAGYIEANPASKVKRPKAKRKMRALSQEEAARLMAVVDSRERAYYDVALKLGLRQGELAALKWETVDLNSRTLMVEATVDTLTAGERWGYTKNSEARTITFGQRTKALLEKLPRSSELVFPGPNGKAVRRSSVLYRFKRYLKEAKLPNIRFHDLRHTCATLGLRSGMPVHVVSKMLGHSDPGFTLRVYSHVLSDMYGDAADKMDGYSF